MHSLLSVSRATRLTVLTCAVGAGWLLSGCGSDSIGPTGRCASVGSLAVEVAVRDSATNQPAAEGAIGTLVGAGVDDTLIHADSLTILGGGKTGTYVVTIAKPGYVTWTASNIRVTNIGECGNVLPVNLSAKLQPAAS